MNGLSDDVYLGVYLFAGWALTHRMQQAGVPLPTGFTQPIPLPAYANVTPAQLVRAGRTGELVQICNQLEQQRNNGEH